MTQKIPRIAQDAAAIEAASGKFYWCDCFLPVCWKRKRGTWRRKKTDVLDHPKNNRHPKLSQWFAISSRSLEMAFKLYANKFSTTGGSGYGMIYAPPCVELCFGNNQLAV